MADRFTSIEREMINLLVGKKFKYYVQHHKKVDGKLYADEPDFMNLKEVLTHNEDVVEKISVLIDIKVFDKPQYKKGAWLFIFENRDKVYAWPWYVFCLVEDDQPKSRFDTEQLAN